jgi:hypothetical protein
MFKSKILLIIPLLIFYLFVGCHKDNDNNGNNTPQTYTVNIVNGTITVPANDYVAYVANVTSSMDNVHLSGNFTASGGSGNDIKVYVMNETNYINWSNGHQSTAYYASGQTTTGSFNVSISTSGKYYVVYDNTFSIISSKNVSTHVDLTYEM